MKASSIPMKASKAEVRAILPKGNEEQDNDDWAKFEADSSYLWKTKISLDTKISWTKLASPDISLAVSILEAQCGGISPSWGPLKRPVLEWRLYALHRSGMKVEDRKQAAGAGTAAKHAAKRMYDPVREASSGLGN